MIPSKKSFKVKVQSAEYSIIVTTWVPEMPDIRFPKLYMPIYCVKEL